MARAAARGEAMPLLVTLGIAAMLAIWAAYAFAGGRAIRRLPLMRTALVLISAVYLLRALSVAPVLVLRPQLIDSFAIWSSPIVLIYGVCYAVGTASAWRALSRLRIDASPQVS